MSIMRRSPVLVLTGLLAGLLITGCTAGDLETEKQPQPAPAGPVPSAVAEPVSGTYTGTQTIELGEPPEDATHIGAELKCLSAGTLTLTDGFEVICQASPGTTTAKSSYELQPGQHSVTITATKPDTQYEAKFVYENGPSIR
ncbi:hypothetical protein [Arthrobacter bussei]|uniref:Lipoprotein n=1 Tax=Arthrobacter bussei TaxID=2594179 RepID=A0A7X1TPX0_9MICC|nr:hypothetical protein [Arthrobacter bussei]MPY12249.1 hypothetical protein [Arthrobacter bussei]